MKDNLTIREFQDAFSNGAFDARDVKTQCEAGWYDWFCDNSKLPAKTQRLGKVVCMLEDSKRVNLDAMYVFFKNNCPMQGPLYDDFRVCDKETGDVQYTVSFKDPHSEDKTLWTVHAVCERPTLAGRWKSYTFRTTAEMVAWFNEKEEE